MVEPQMRTDWHGCYDDGWQGLIVPEAMAHPAKMARGLLTRIIRHGLDRGYWQPGDLIGDPFFGIGSTGIIGASYGLRVVGCELEEKFCALAERNFALHRRKWEACGDPMPVCIQGDSRRFAELVRPVAAVVTSPQFLDTYTRGGATIEGRHHQVAWAQRQGGPEHRATYGQTPGQIGSLPAGDLAAVVTSPPWEDQLNNHDKTWTPPHETTGSYQADYGNGPDQIGNDSGETYWQAMCQVYEQVRLALRPGGVAAIVVKDYVKAGKRVPLCDQTCMLLGSLGFTVFERTRAWLVKTDSHPSLFGGEVTKTKERKSFFRRLAEKRGSPRIDFEEVIWARK